MHEPMPEPMHEPIPPANDIGDAEPSTLAMQARHAQKPAIVGDTHRLYGRFSVGLLLRGALMQPSFRVVATLRLCQASHRLPRGLRLLTLLPAKVLHHLACWVAGIELPWRTQVGTGLALTHGRGMVVSEGARIGRNVTLFHGVTIGRQDGPGPDGERAPGYPVLEDEVWVGPNAIIVGGVTIGRGSRIAGGAFVNVDVPPACVVLGNPGRVVKTGCAADVQHRYPGWEE